MKSSLRKVLISDDIDPICGQLLMQNGIEVIYNTKLTNDQLKEKIKDFDGLIVRSATKVTKEIIEAGKNLKIIGRAGTGLDNINIEVAKRAGIEVRSTPFGNSRSAAELTCSMLLCLARKVPQANDSMKDGKWDRKTFMGIEMSGKTLGIVGLGNVGQKVAVNMMAFGMTVIGYDELVDYEVFKNIGVEKVSLDKIWSHADFITFHVPLLRQTENMLNALTFALCKKGVYVVNCARGGIINEKDLLDALKSGQCAGAALDVYVEEPPKNLDLVRHPNVIATPHLGASTNEAQFKVAQEIAYAFVQFNRDQTNKNG